nr:hypothetical transcript [Hymenolepis microstoma]
MPLLVKSRYFISGSLENSVKQCVLSFNISHRNTKNASNSVGVISHPPDPLFRFNGKPMELEREEGQTVVACVNILCSNSETRLVTVSDGSSPFHPEGHIGGMLVGRILLFCEDVSPGNRVRYTV